MENLRERAAGLDDFKVKTIAELQAVEMENRAMKRTLAETTDEARTLGTELTATKKEAGNLREHGAQVRWLLCSPGNKGCPPSHRQRRRQWRRLRWRLRWRRSWWRLPFRVCA